MTWTERCLEVFGAGRAGPARPARPTLGSLRPAGAVTTLVVRLWRSGGSDQSGGDVRGQVLHVQTGELTAVRDLDDLIGYLKRRSAQSLP